MVLKMQGPRAKPAPKKLPAYTGKHPALVKAQMDQDQNRVNPVKIPPGKKTSVRKAPARRLGPGMRLVPRPGRKK